MHRQLRELLQLLTAPEELQPGIWRGSYGDGINRFGVEARDKAGRLTVRVVPADFLPAPVAAHPIVKTRLGRLGDILESGQLIVDDVCRAVLEVEIRGQDQVPRILESIHMDCVRLRAAAAGMAAATPLATADAAPAAPPGTPGLPGLGGDGPLRFEDSGALDSGDADWFGAPLDARIVARPATSSGRAGAAPRGAAAAPAQPPAALPTPAAAAPAPQPAAARPRVDGPPLEAFPADLFAAPGARSGAPAARGTSASPVAGGETRWGGSDAASDLAASGLRPGAGGGAGAGGRRGLLDREPAARDEGLTRFYAPSPAALPSPPSPEPKSEDPDTDSWGAQTRPKVEGFPHRAARLLIIEGANVGRAFALDQRDAFCIGRSPHVEIHLDDQVVSRRNSLVQWKPGGQLWIEDLGSYNGTRVNGQPATGQELHAGDIVEVGWTKLRVEALPDAETGTGAALRRLR